MFHIFNNNVIMIYFLTETPQESQKLIQNQNEKHTPKINPETWIFFVQLSSAYISFLQVLGTFPNSRNVFSTAFVIFVKYRVPIVGEGRASE